MKEIYDIVTKKNITLERGKLIKQSKELGFDYSSLQRLFFGEVKHLMARYILPENKINLITLVNFETGDEYDCISLASLRYYINKNATKNDTKYFYELTSRGQTSATICGIMMYIKGSPKTNRFCNMKSNGDKYKQKVLEQKLRQKISSRLRCRIKNSLLSNKKNKTRELIGCNVDFLMGYLEKQFSEGMSWENYGKWHIDHIFPLSSFDLTNGDEQIKACNYTNLQPLWAADNLRKSNKLPADFALKDSTIIPTPQNIS